MKSTYFSSKWETEEYPRISNGFSLLLLKNQTANCHQCSCLIIPYPDLLQGFRRGVASLRDPGEEGMLASQANVSNYSLLTPVRPMLFPFLCLLYPWVSSCSWMHCAKENKFPISKWNFHFSEAQICWFILTEGVIGTTLRSFSFFHSLITSTLNLGSFDNSSIHFGNGKLFVFWFVDNRSGRAFSFAFSLWLWNILKWDRGKDEVFSNIFSSHQL